MDVFEKLNRKFGAWYEGFFGGSPGGDLRPRGILRRILTTMEDHRSEGLDGQVYVPNLYIIEVVIADEDERHYLRAFLDADELAVAVRRYGEQHGLKTRGGLQFRIKEIEASSSPDGADRVRVRCRFDASLPEASLPEASLPERATGHAGVAPPEEIADAVRAAPPALARALDDYAEGEEPGTVPALAPASLTVRAPGSRQETYPLTARGLQIGRSRQVGNDIVLAGDGMVSKRHARIEHNKEGFVLYDLHSTNGTFVNDVPVEISQFLRSGDEVRVGGTTLLFHAGVPQATLPLSGFGAPSPGIRLVGSKGETYPLATRMTVGHALTGDIVLTGEGVAARHAILMVRGDQVYVEDLNTLAGTFVNGERIPSNFAVAVYDGDTVSFGSLCLHLERSRQLG